MAQPEDPSPPPKAQPPRFLTRGFAIVLFLALAMVCLNMTTNSYQSDDRTRHGSESKGQKTENQRSNYDWIPQEFSKKVYASYPVCSGSVNKPDIINTLEQAPWNDMDWEAGADGQGHAACGAFKCYLISRSDPTAGYLIAKPEFLEPMISSSKLQWDLHESMGARILEILGENPQLMDISTSVACLLEEQAFQGGKPQKGYPETRQVIAQKVRRAPEPHIVIGFGGEKLKHISYWAAFLKEHNANATAAYQQIPSEIRKLNKAFKKYPGLMHDFQIIVDVRGYFYHMDVDRAFEETENNAGQLRTAIRKEKLKIALDAFLNTAELAAKEEE